MRKSTIPYRLLLFYITLLHCGAVVIGQQPDSWSYQFYTTAHGLPSSEIICLSKDNKGFLWLGTSAGLSLYDGYSFKNYAYSADKELVGYVNVIKRGIDDKLWIGSAAGLFCYTNNEIIKLSAPTNLPQGVNDILVEESGVIWLATENGPVKLNSADLDLSGKKKTVLADFLLEQWYLKDEIIDNRRTLLVNKSPDGAIFIAQYHNLFRFSDNKLELIHTTPGPSDRILSLFPISKSKIYFDGASTEINKFEDGITSSAGFANFYKQGENAELPGEWYIGTRGAFYFHPQTGTASQLIVFSDKYVVWTSAILKDNGFLWLASHDGLLKLRPSIFTSYTIDKAPTFNDYYSITELHSGKIILGANLGRIFEKKSDSFSLLYEKLVPRAEIKDLYEDERGWLWIASGYQGLVVLRNGKSERFTADNGLHDNSLAVFLRTSDNRLYVLGDQGLSEILVDGNNAISFKKFYYQPNSSQYAKFYSGIEGPDGSIWMGGEEGIVYLRKDSLHKFTFGARQLSVNFLIKDKEGNIWIAASGEGILQCVFNKKNELEIKHQFTENEGLNTLHYLTLLADEENNIWAGSSKGISVIGRAGRYKDRILHFDESDGFIKGGYSYIRLHQARDSTIWAATVFGVTSFRPGHLLLSESAPVVYISGITQPNRKQQPFPVNNQFSYSNNSFNFNFAALDYPSQENIRYYYKLEGLDTNWVNSGSLRSISFENLPSGTYTFRVKALNSKSIWSKNDAVYSFVITLPFWKTWWFLSLALLLVALLTIILARARIQFVKNREAEKTSKEMEVMRLNRDLANSQLTALRMQMNPHFIFNALNSVQHFILQGNVTEANRYLSRFSKLQREILHSSSEHFITLEKEIDIINRYLELEQYRFGESFTYQVSMTDEIEPEEIKIPPMVLQPFVENAIWHGLMPRQKNRALNIHFDLQTDDILLVILRDNGIGRAASAKLKQNNVSSKPGHESRGMSMVQQRLRLLQLQYDKPFEALISDITDVSGTVQGTQVTLKIFIGNKKS